MAKLLKLRRGTTSQHGSFTGAEGEVTVDTDKETLVVHNGSTAGGFPVMSASGGTFTGAVTFNAAVNYEGDLDLQDGDKLLIGTGDDLQIFHDGSDSYIKDTGTGQLLLQTNSLRVHNAAANELQIAADEDSDVELYFNGVKKFNTTADGATITGRLSPAADDSYGLGQSSLRFANLFLSGDIDMNDNDKIKLGTGNDLQIYHDSNDTYIDNNVGDFYIRNAGNSTSEKIRIQAKGGEQSILCSPNGAVELYWDNAKHFETVNTGAKVSGKLQVTDDLNLDGANSNSWWDKSDNSFKFDDNTKASFGNHVDLKIYHDGTYNRIQSAQSRALVIEADTAIAYLRAKINEESVRCNPNGTVELFYDDARKIKTSPSGVEIYNHAYFLDSNNSIYMGPSSQLRMHFDGSNSVISSSSGDNYYKSNGNTYIRCAGDENAVVAVANGEVKLYHNNSQKLHTTASGIEITGGIEMDDGQQIKLGDGQELKIWHDSNSHSYITESGSGGVVLGGSQVTLMNLATTEAYVRCYDNNTTELFYDNSKKLHTTSSGVYITGHVDLADVDKLRLGASQDLDLYHDGSNSYIRNSAGIFYIRGNELRLEAYSGERYMDCTENSAVALYHNNSKKFETTSSGVTVTGTITATGGGLGGLYDAHAFIEDRKSAATNGGTFSSGAWRHRDLNTEVYDPDGIVSISSNNFALAGSSSDKYRVYFIAPAYKVDVHQARLYCTTNSSVITYGMATVSKGNAPVTSESMGEARCDGGKTYRIEHYSWQTIGSEGFGSTWEANWCQGRFTQIQIQREAS